MARRAQPYGVTVHVDPMDPAGLVVGHAPTVATRRHFGWNSFLGLVQHGTKRGKVPINHPYPGQGASFPAFPHVTGSSVAPDFITPALLVARNLYSPSGHSNPLSNFVPPQAQYPIAKPRPPQTQTGRPSGRFTVPHPPTTQWWPTSQQWLAQRLRLSQQPPSGWQGHGGPFPAGNPPS